MLSVGGVGHGHGAIQRDVVLDGRGDGAAHEAQDFVDPAAYSNRQQAGRWKLLILLAVLPDEGGKQGQSM